MTSNPFRIAYCIECHQYTPVLQELIEQLQGPDTDIYMHVDRKSNIRTFAPLAGKVHFVKPRIKVYWGHVSQIECMLRLFDATRQSPCNYIVLLSGNSLPLYDREHIQDFLASAYERRSEFIHALPDILLKEMRDKMQQTHYLPARERRYKRFWFKRKLIVPHLSKVNPLWRKIAPLEKGCNWIAFTDRFRDYAFDYVASHPDYMRYFRYSSCGDELFFQTIIGDSPFAPYNTRQALTYTDWSVERPPRIFGDADLEELAALKSNPEGQKSHYLFARKFDNHLDLNAYRKLIINQS